MAQRVAWVWAGHPSCGPPPREESIKKMCFSAPFAPGFATTSLLAPPKPLKGARGSFQLIVKSLWSSTSEQT
jgi:hypothetical protein